MMPTVLTLKPEVLIVYGESQDRANDEQEDAEADTHRHASSDAAELWSGLLSAGLLPL
jgi:hypothetical protein